MRGNRDRKRQMEAEKGKKREERENKVENSDTVQRETGGRGRDS